MKKKLSFIVLFTIVAISALLFSGCDFLFGNDDPNKENPNNGTCIHNWVWEVTTPATYTADGLSSGRCSKCGASGGTQPISRLTCTTHNYVWRTATPATDDADGIAAERCSRCGTASGNTEPIPAGTVLEEEDSQESGNDELEAGIYIPDGGEPGPDSVSVIVGPLLQTNWGQGSPYRNMLPERSRGGCIGVAIAQIMNFHRHPLRGSGQSEPYTSSHGVNVPSVNFGDVYFDWDNMQKKYNNANPGTEQQRNAVAALFRYMAIGIQMSFGFDGAGGAVSSGPLTKGLTTFFNYDRSLDRLQRSFYDDDAEWEGIIRAQLDNGLPVYYFGLNRAGNSGHGFVIDGYDNNGKFHINWGWGGSADGWYSLNALNTRTYEFNGSQFMIINIKPNKGGIGTNKTALTAFTAEKTTVPQNELFQVTAKLISVGFFSGGHVGVALTNDKDEIVEIIGMNSHATSSFNALAPVGQRTATIRCFVPETVEVGQYRLRIVTRTNDEDWKLVTLSEVKKGIPNAIELEVTPYIGVNPGGGYGISLETFTPEKVSVSYGETFSVAVKARKIGEYAFPGGQVGVALADNNGDIVEVFRTMNWALLNPGAGYRSQTINNCRIPGTVAHGSYQLRIVVRPEGGEWRIATLAANISTSIDFTVTSGGSPSLDLFLNEVATYRTAANDVEVIVDQNLTISQLVSIPAPAATGATLTIRSANPSQPVTLTRGVSGNLFTVTNGATLIFRDIIIDGGNGGDFVESGGGTLVRVNSSSFVMNDGAVLCNNTNTTTTHPGGGVFTSANSSFTMNGGVISGNNSTSGGGVYIYNTCTFTMTGGEISGNTANSNGGGVYTTSTFNITVGEISGNKAAFGGGVFTSGSAIFTMNGGKIRGNTTTSSGGGVYINGTNPFIMTGGEISGNTASSGNGVRINTNGIFDQFGGVVAGTGSALTNVVSGTYNLNNGTGGAPNNAVVIAWNSTSTNLTVSTGGTAVWEDQSGVLGISYVNGANAGWIKAW